jgi:glycosyltransferase involved in cell wall biosynthesis
MPSVLFWVNVAGGTGEYRCHVPGRALARQGWDVTFEEEGIDVTVDGRVRGDPDVLVLCRVAGEFVPDAVRRIRARGRTLVVYDVDDWFAGIPAYNPASTLHRDDLNEMHQAMREADLITCSTPELAEGYGVLNRTVVLPNYLDPDIWQPYQDMARLRSHVHLGWAGAFHWRAGDLDLIQPWIYDFLDTHRQVRFAAIGCSELLTWLGIDGLTTPRLPAGARTTDRDRDLHPYTHLPAMLANLDIGLVPLTHNRFNQAKSHCKGMEYGAMNVPAIASPSREYRKYIRPGINGLLARGNWAKQIDTVLDDLDTYRAGARKVADEYWIDDHIDKWINAYRTAWEEVKP